MPKSVKPGSARVEKIKKFQYSPMKVQLALNAIDKGMPVLKASQEFKVPRTTLRNKLEGKSPRESTGRCGFDSYLGRDNEEMLVKWVLECCKMGFPITKDGLLTSVQKIVNELKIKTPFLNGRPGRTWFYSFLNRHKEIAQKKAEYLHRGRGAVTEVKIRNWFKEVEETLGDDKNVLEVPERVFNMDESGFTLAPKIGVVLGPRGRHVYDERTASDKENVTTLFAVNASGMFAPPLTIFKYDRIPSNVAKSAPKHWGIGKSENGWMTAECFFEYITNVFVPFVREKQIPFPIVIFVDGHVSFDPTFK